VNPELGNDNPEIDADAGVVDNSPVAAEEIDTQADAETNGTEGSSDGEDGSGSFWSGNPLDLEPENLAIYREMQSGLTRKTQEVADMKRGVESDRAKMQEQQNQLQQAFLALQAQQVGQRPNGADNAAQETAPTVDELRQRFTEKAQNGDGFGALLEVMDARLKANSGSSEREVSLMDEIEKLRSQVDSVAETFAPHREASRLNAIFEDMKGGQYREFRDERVQGQVRQILDSNDPTITKLLSSGTEDAYRAALSLAGERAIRAVNEGRLINTAKRRAEAAPPATQAGTASSPVGSTANMSMDEILNAVLGQDSDLGSRLS
jgi:hypothetical protein